MLAKMGEGNEKGEQDVAIREQSGDVIASSDNVPKSTTRIMM